jgi:dihydroceramidase
VDASRHSAESRESRRTYTRPPPPPRMFAFFRSRPPPPPPPPAQVWGEVTANYDGCEHNYAVSRYVAEFANTVSSLPTITVGLYFLLKARQHHYGFRLSLAGAMLALVGVGSVAFHGTLTRFGQVLDELPMLYSSSIFLWISGSLHLPAGPKGDAQSARLGLALLVYCVAVTAAYANGGFEVFFVAYALTVLAVAVTSIRAAGKSAVKATTKPYVKWALCIYIGGFGTLWVPEQLFCGNRLQVTHHSPLQDLPVPLHAFFHVTSSIGPLAWLTFAAFEELHRVKRGPVISWRSHPLLWGVPGPAVLPKRVSP